MRAKVLGSYCESMNKRIMRHGATPAALLTHPTRRAFASAFLLFVAFALSLALVGCSQDKNKGEDSTEALPPVIAEVSELDGATFEISESQPLVINAPDPVDWAGVADDPEVAEFVPGKEEDGGATYNPSFEAKGAGETAASMTSPAGETYDFTLVVK